jgi:hypothetical protein
VKTRDAIEEGFYKHFSSQERDAEIKGAARGWGRRFGALSLFVIAYFSSG